MSDFELRVTVMSEAHAKDMISAMKSAGVHPARLDYSWNGARHMVDVECNNLDEIENIYGLARIWFDAPVKNSN